MGNEFGATMRRALEAVRSGDVSGATEMLQRALVPAGVGARLPRLRRPLRDVVRLLREGRAGFVPGEMPVPPVPEPPVGEGAQFLDLLHSGPSGSRRYRLFVPASAEAAPRGLVLMLHGCKQTPEDFAVGTRMNEVAAGSGLLVAYPAQSRTDNAMGCWNWFRPGDQQRDMGEPAILAALTREVAARYAIPADKVFAAGLSAGGAMAAVLGETYPDLFDAVGVHSGLARGSASDAVSAFAVMRGDPTPTSAPRGPTSRLIVFQGDADRTVHPSNASRVSASAPAGETTSSERGSANGYGYSRSASFGGDGRPTLEAWMIEGAGHNWSGGNPAGSFADAAGPDASAEMVRFFLA